MPWILTAMLAMLVCVILIWRNRQYGFWAAYAVLLVIVVAFLQHATDNLGLNL